LVYRVDDVASAAGLTACQWFSLTDAKKKKKTDLTQLLVATSFGSITMYTHIDEYEWLSVEQTLILAGRGVTIICSITWSEF
jgi:hypothetical protein